MPGPIAAVNCGEVFVKNVQMDFADAKGVGKAFFNNSTRYMGDLGATPGVFAAVGGYSFSLLGGLLGSIGNGVANLVPGDPSCYAQAEKLERQDFDMRVAQTQAKWQRDPVEIPGAPAAPQNLRVE